MITYKKIRETEKEMAHVRVYQDQAYIGYIVRNTGYEYGAGLREGKFVFTSDELSIPCRADLTIARIKKWLEAGTYKDANDGLGYDYTKGQI